MLSRIGYLTIPPDVLVKFRVSGRLTGIEKDMLKRVPEAAQRLLWRLIVAPEGVSCLEPDPWLQAASASAAAANPQARRLILFRTYQIMAESYESTDSRSIPFFEREF